ncbi:MAG: hypothetical protein OXI30_01710, partial [Chloroflexota bacterium]|nr:hypothetical protein [Chloroflexota bacterium]
WGYNLEDGSKNFHRLRYTTVSVDSGAWGWALPANCRYPALLARAEAFIIFAARPAKSAHSSACGDGEAVFLFADPFRSDPDL